MANRFITDTRVVNVESSEGADMSEQPYTPPDWPRFMFAADGRSQQFQSQEEVDATGEQWFKTPAEAQQAQQASQARQPSPPPPSTHPPDDEGSTGEAPPHTPRRR
jgi:hypothetical protein